MSLGLIAEIGLLVIFGIGLVPMLDRSNHADRKSVLLVGICMGILLLLVVQNIAGSVISK